MREDKLNIVDDVAIAKSDEVVIKDTASAVDFVMEVKSKTGCHKIALNKEAITGEFFILSSGLAGEILQKFVNYGIKFAIYGDYSKYTSKPLRDFIYESNKGKDVFFVKDADKAVRMLGGSRGKVNLAALDNEPALGS